MAYPDSSERAQRVALASGDVDELEWTPEALAKLQNIPFFARSPARLRIEELARAHEVDLVTVELVKQARSEFGQ